MDRRVVDIWSEDIEENEDIVIIKIPLDIGDGESIKETEGQSLSA